MMRKLIIATLLAVVSSTAAQAQRMMQGQKGLEISAGLLSNDVKNNYHLNLTMTVNGKNGNYWIYGVEYAHQFSGYREVQIPLEAYTGEVGYSIQLISDTRKTFALNAGLSAVGGYETINRSESILYDGSRILDKNNFIYGAGGRLSFETYLSDHFVLLLQGRTKVLWGTDLKQIRPSADVGIRFNF